MSVLLVFCKGNPPVTGGFPSQKASNLESISISPHHHASLKNVDDTLGESTRDPNPYEAQQNPVL